MSGNQPSTMVDQLDLGGSLESPGKSNLKDENDDLIQFDSLNDIKNIEGTESNNQQSQSTGGSMEESSKKEIINEQNNQENDQIEKSEKIEKVIDELEKEENDQKIKFEIQISNAQVEKNSQEEGKENESMNKVECKCETLAKLNELELIHYLCNFLKNENELNPLLAGYFYKAMNALLSRYRIETIQFLEDHCIIDQMIYHIYNKSISDLLFKILSNDEPSAFQANETEENKTKKIKIVDKLFAKMISSEISDEIISSCMIICRMIDNKMIINYLTDIPQISKVYAIALRHHPVALRSGLTMIVNMIKLLFPAPNAFEFSYGGGNSGNLQEIDLSYDQDIIISTIQHFSDIISILVQLSKLEYDQRSQSGSSSMTAGLAILKIVEWIYYITTLKKNLGIAEIQKANKLPSLLLNIMAKFKMNSTLHGKILQYFNEIINSKSQEFHEMLIIGSNVPQTLIKIITESKMMYENSKKPLTSPCVPYFLKIASTINNFSKDNNNLKEYLQRVENWGEIVKLITDNEAKEKIVFGKQPDNSNVNSSPVEVENEKIRKLLEKITNKGGNKDANQVPAPTNQGIPAKIEENDKNEVNENENTSEEHGQEIQVKLESLHLEEANLSPNITDTKLEITIENNYSENEYWKENPTSLSIDLMNEYI